MRPAAFLDRDDTLVENAALPWAEIGAPPGDLCDPARVRLLPGVLESCRLLKEAGYALVVITNQGLVARGVGTCADVERTNQRLLDLLTIDGRPLIDAVRYCPYHPRGTVPEFTREHPWRKPAPGMILDAAAALDLDLGRSWLIGDADRDIQAGIAAGIPPERCLRIGPGQPLPDLRAATRGILGA